MAATEQTRLTVRKHPVYWFEDGSLTFEVESQVFLVHGTLLSRHSRVLAKSDTRYIVLPSNYRAEDLEALLQCLYHDKWGFYVHGIAVADALSFQGPSGTTRPFPRQRQYCGLRALTN